MKVSGAVYRKSNGEIIVHLDDPPPDYLSTDEQEIRRFEFELEHGLVEDPAGLFKFGLALSEYTTNSDFQNLLCLFLAEGFKLVQKP